MAGLNLTDERGYNQIFAPVGATPVRQRRRTDWMLAQIERVGAKRVLEIGSGTGENAALIAAETSAEVVAVDISQAFIDIARHRHMRGNLRFELLDLLGDEVLEFGKFDLVCGNGILHHLVKQLPRVLGNLHRMTNPGGGLAFIEPNFLNPYCAFAFGTKLGRRMARLEPDEMAFTPGELRSALADAGWKNVAVNMQDFLVPGLPLPLVKPVLAIEPALEATPLTRWLAQSHFMTASA